MDLAASEDAVLRQSLTLWAWAWYWSDYLKACLSLVENGCNVSEVGPSFGEQGHKCYWQYKSEQTGLDKDYVLGWN